MTDERQRLGQQRGLPMYLLVPLRRTLTHHGAEHQVSAFGSNGDKFGHTSEVD
jgi:hypothetical protein